MPLPAPLSASTATSKGGINGQDQPAVGSATGTTVGGSAAVQKKEAGVPKVLADKKKMDARKKSLKRL